MKSIFIDHQASANDLLKATATAIANTINWTLSSNEDETEFYLRKDISDIYIKMEVKSNVIYTYFVNEPNGSNTSSHSWLSLTFNSSNVYYIYVIDTGISIALGGSCGTNSPQVPKLSGVLTQNTNGNYMGINVNSNAIYIIGEAGTRNNLSILANYTSPIFSTSLVKMPDFFNACMYKELYYFMSSSVSKTSNMRLYISGKYYRPIGDVSGVGASYIFAIPDDDQN